MPSFRLLLSRSLCRRPGIVEPGIPPPGRVRWLRPSEIAHGDQSVLFVGDAPGDGRIVSGQVDRATQLHPSLFFFSIYGFERLGGGGIEVDTVIHKLCVGDVLGFSAGEKEGLCYIVHGQTEMKDAICLENTHVRIRQNDEA